MSHLLGPHTIHVVGARPQDALGLVLRKAFDNILFSPNQTTPVQKSDLAVGICTGRGDAWLQSFTRSAHDAGIPSLCVNFGDDSALIGSLTVPGRVGCSRCAFERITAAAATAELAAEPTQPVPQEEVSKKIAPVLVREIQTIIRDGAEQSELLDHVLAVDSETLDESLHKVIPLPFCAVCGGASALNQTTRESVLLTPEDSPEVLLEALAGWVDRRTGVISNLFIEPAGDLEVSLPIIATAAPPHLMEEDGSLRRLPLGWGKGLTISGAVLSAVGEAIERYAPSISDPKQIIRKRPDEFDEEFLDPRGCSLYTDAQYERDGFPYVRFETHVRHPWVLGNWADNGKPVWVPAIFVFLSLTLIQAQMICQGTSNGLAAATNRDDAALKAILELVERDAFMAAWLTAVPAQRIELDSTLDPLLREVLKGIEGLGATIEIYLLPNSACGTTFLCLALGDGEQYPGVTFGLGTDLQPYSALQQAILELGQTGPFLRRMMRSKALATPNDPSSVKEMLDHAAYYFPSERANAFDRLRNNHAPVRLSDLKSVEKPTLESCVIALKAAGVRVALVDVTSPDVATGPFRVMRAVSPDLQPIWYGYGLERQPVERVQRLKIAPDIPPINPIW
jgi:ribosomal protein S12 methylthiotransferase accessory factor